MADLAPLAGMPIKTIDLSMTPVVDFSPLARLPLEKCYLQANRITDLSVFRGKPLKELVLWGCTEPATTRSSRRSRRSNCSCSPPSIAACRRTTTRRSAQLRDHLAAAPALGRRDEPACPTPEPGPRTSSGRIGTASRRSCRHCAEKRGEVLARQARRLEVLTSPSKTSRCRNLSILKGDAAHLPRRDRLPGLGPGGPLRDLPIETLLLRSDSIADLGPLRGMSSLKALLLGGSGVRDLSPLAGLPLKELYVDGCSGVKDAAAIGGITTLENVTVPPLAANIDAPAQTPQAPAAGLPAHPLRHPRHHGGRVLEGIRLDQPAARRVSSPSHLSVSPTARGT